MSAKFRELRALVYTLKRLSGQAIFLCRTTNNATNLDTGIQSEVLVRVAIARAVMMPTKGQRGFNYDRAFIAAARNFTYGGFFDHKFRQVLVDRRDVPQDFPIDLNMHLEFGGKRYEVKEVNEYEESEALMLTIDALAGSMILDSEGYSFEDVLHLGETLVRDPLPGYAIKDVLTFGQSVVTS